MGSKTPTFWWVLASCALMAVGGLGPWGIVLGVSISGTEIRVRSKALDPRPIVSRALVVGDREQ